MTKIIFPIVLIAVFIIAIVLKRNYKNNILENALTTQGLVTAVFQKGKLPFCEYTYTINNVIYTNKQDIPLHLKNSILNKRYPVFYNIETPKKAIIKFE